MSLIIRKNVSFLLQFRGIFLCSLITSQSRLLRGSSSSAARRKKNPPSHYINAPRFISAAFFAIFFFFLSLNSLYFAGCNYKRKYQDRGQTFVLKRLVKSLARKWDRNITRWKVYIHIYIYKAHSQWALILLIPFCLITSK